MDHNFPWFKEVCVGCGADSVGGWHKSNPRACLHCGHPARRMQLVKYLNKSEQHQVREEMSRAGMIPFDQYRQQALNPDDAFMEVATSANIRRT